MIVALLVVTLGSVAVGAAGVAGYKVNKRKSFKRRYRAYRRGQARRLKERAKWQEEKKTIARDIHDAKRDLRANKAAYRDEKRTIRDERREARRRAAEARAQAAQATQQAPPATSTPPPAKKTAPAKTTQRRPATPTTQAAAGQCGAPTADGTACDRAATKPGMCGIDSHRPGPWAAGKKKATATP